MKVAAATGLSVLRGAGVVPVPVCAAQQGLAGRRQTRYSMLPAARWLTCRRSPSNAMLLLLLLLLTPTQFQA